MRRFSLLLAVALLAAFGSTTAQAQTPHEVVQALTWLRAQQQPDGGFSNGFAPGSDPGTTADAVLAIVAGGEDPAAWSAGAATPLTYLEAAASSQPMPAGLAAKLTLAAAAAGLDPAGLGGTDLQAALEGSFEAATGLYGSGPYDSALAMLALHTAGRAIPAQAADGLLAYRLDDGSFSFNGDTTAGAGDSNTTALAVQALVASGRKDAVAPSIAYFRATQNPDAGWTYQKPSAFGEATDANSTALVMQALAAAGEAAADWGDPVQALLALQLPSGAFVFNASTSSENLLATVQAVPALAGVPLTDVGRLTADDAGQPSAGWLDVGLVIGTLVALGMILIGAALIAHRRQRSA
jgi:hypothetical protein